MSLIKFPCGHTSSSFEIECTPVIVKAAVYMRREDGYTIEQVQIDGTFGDEDLRRKLLSKHKVPEISKNVKATCPSCKIKCSCDDLTVIISCNHCAKAENITFCNHKKLHLCAKCIGMYCEVCGKEMGKKSLKEAK